MSLLFVGFEYSFFHIDSTVAGELNELLTKIAVFFYLPNRNLSLTNILCILVFPKWECSNSDGCLRFVKSARKPIHDRLCICEAISHIIIVLLFSNNLRRSFSTKPHHGLGFVWCNFHPLLEWELRFLYHIGEAGLDTGRINCWFGGMGNEGEGSRILW